MHRIRGYQKLILIAMAVSALALMPGCRSAQPGEDPDAGGSQVTEVRIGFAAPLTGDNAVFGQGMKRAVELAFKEANESPEVREAGYRFVLRAEDDQGDPKQAVNVANILAGDSSILGVIGHFNSGCSIPAAPVYQQAGLAMITVSSNPELTAKGLTVVNRIVAKDDAQGGYAARLVSEDLGATRVVVIDDATQYGQGLADEFVKAFEAKGGTVLLREQVQPKTVDFSALVTRIRGLAPEAVYYAGAHTEGGLLSKQMSESGMGVPLIGGDMIFSQEYIDIAGAGNAEGDMATSLGLPLEQQPKGKDFKAAYEAEFGQAPEAFDSYAYDQAWIFVRAVLEAGTDRAAIAQAIRNGSFDGVTGLTEFDENGDTTNQVISAYVVSDGKWNQIVE
ncbi:MAG: branched-chain amino acid ABC transporter substrate-binding protein [Actinobacteria bacterium]|nr:branched-chain amino acid ABC transporter substrate-binding protein [Actinomycetota bacterium]